MSFEDIIVLVDTDDEYLDVFRRVGRAAEGMECMHYIFDAVPLQMFPTTTMPLYRDALDQAHLTRIGNLRVKAASPERLILMYLQAFRPKDRVRIPALLEISEDARITKLLSRFDDEQSTLAQRLQTLRPSSV